MTREATSAEQLRLVVSGRPVSSTRRAHPIRDSQHEESSSEQVDQHDGLADVGAFAGGEQGQGAALGSRRCESASARSGTSSSDR